MAYYSIFAMREDVSNAYDSPTWKHRVKFMPDKQIYAIWHDFYASGKFDKKLPKRAEKMVEVERESATEVAGVSDGNIFEPIYGEQLSFDIL